MGRSKVLSSVATLAISAGVVAGIVFLGASAQTRTPGTDLDCPGDLRIAATFATSEAKGARTPNAATSAIAHLTLRDFDEVTSQDGIRIVRNGSRRVAAVSVVQTTNGYYAEGIEACASDYVSP